MPQQGVKPPPILACSRVLEYAILDESVCYSGHSNLFVGGHELGRVPCLAISYDTQKGHFFLLHCNQNWDVLGIAQKESVAKAKASADATYTGVSALWVAPSFTEQDVTRYLDQSIGAQRCNFCGRTPLDFENPRFIQKNDSCICESCVKACYELLRSDDQDA
jgi:hypothetical protein